MSKLAIKALEGRLEQVNVCWFNFFYASKTCYEMFKVGTQVDKMEGNSHSA